MKDKANAVSVGVLIQRFSPIFILIVLIIFMSLANDRFFQVANFINIFRQIAILGVVSMGMTLVILTGGIDLSVGPMMAVSAAIMGVAATQWGIAPVPAVALGLAAGTVLGVINGMVITKGQIQPFIATLGMMVAARGVVLLLTGGLAVRGIPEPMLTIGSRFVGRIPQSAFVLVAVAVVAWILLNKTTFGRNIMAIGGNSEASRTSGIRVDRVKIIVYAICGFFCAIAGFLYMGRVNSVPPLMASGMELQAITAVALGGTSLSGGNGSIMGTVIGVITIGVLNNGLNLMNVSAAWQQVILGIMITIVVILDSWRKRKFD
ncbi:MAG: ABC transporter permease [Defluviitaleaceae bacterium]|nr:ABC transporter permease [Defluviitaleaceae bacterium]